MVKRVRSTSRRKQPICLSWLRMRASYWSFQVQMLPTKASRPRSWRFLCSFLEDAAFDDGLGGDAGVVGAGHPEGVVALHASPAGEDVLQGVVEGMAEVEGAGDVWGGDDDGEGGLFAVGMGGEVAAIEPEGVPATFGFVRVVLLGEVRDAHTWLNSRFGASSAHGRPIREPGGRLLHFPGRSGRGRVRLACET